MQATIFKLARSLCAGALLLSGCSYEHPGPTLPSADEAASPPADASPPPAARTAIVSSSKKSTPGEATRPGAAPAASSPAVAPGAEPLPQSPSASPAAATPGPGEDSTAGLYPEGVSAATDAGSGFDNIEVLDASLKTELTILRVGSQPTANQLLSVFAGLKNKSSRVLELEVQTIYKDKAGADLNAGSWIPVTLQPREETEYHSASISPDAVDFLVRVRLAPSPSP